MAWCRECLNYCDDFDLTDGLCPECMGFNWDPRDDEEEE